MKKIIYSAALFMIFLIVTLPFYISDVFAQESFVTTYNISGVSSPEDVENQIEEANSKLIDNLKSMIR